MSLKPVIIISGYAASGKTTLARKLANNIGFGFVDLGSIIRRSFLDYLSYCGVSEIDDVEEVLNDEEKVSRFVNDMELYPINLEQGLELVVNGRVLDIEDGELRNPILDDRTLNMARLIRPRLIEVQRECAKLSPVVFSARNAIAFEPDEAIRIHIDPGMTTRVRRRAIYEGKEYCYLSREEKRNIIQRVVGKEWQSMSLEVAMNPEKVEGENFHIFKNLGSIEESLVELTDLSLKVMRDRGWITNVYSPLKTK